MSGRIEHLQGRIGIFGGTFDPPHIAHLVLAMEACEQLGLSHLLWVLTASPPHKQDQPITPVEQRAALVQAAIGDDPHFVFSRIEIDRPGPHYAADTVGLLAEEMPQASLCYLIGGDSLHDLPGWRSPQAIVDGCECLGVMRRPGDRIDLVQLEAKLPGIGEKVRFFHTPEMGISSTEIRERARLGRSFRYFVPDAVFRLICDLRLYRACETPTER